MSWLSVGAGAMLGAWLRWRLMIWLGGLHSHLQVGTLAANLGGGYLVGLALGFFAATPSLSPEWRLFVVTGFLGGLTTFSSFSGESLVLLQRGHYVWAFAHTTLHVVGSLGFCTAGFMTWRTFST